MAWTTPKTWTTGEVLTAANMNTYLRDNTAWLGTDKPHCRVQKSTATSITNATNTAISFDTEYIDVGAMHSTVTNTSRVTIPSGGGGVYAVVAGAEFASNATGYRTAFVLVNNTNTVTNVTMQAVNGNTTIIQCPGIVNQVAGDYFELFVVQGSGGALNCNSTNYYSPMLSVMWQST